MDEAAIEEEIERRLNELGELSLEEKEELERGIMEFDFSALQPRIVEEVTSFPRDEEIEREEENIIVQLIQASAARLSVMDSRMEASMEGLEDIRKVGLKEAHIPVLEPEAEQTNELSRQASTGEAPESPEPDPGIREAEHKDDETIQKELEEIERKKREEELRIEAEKVQRMKMLEEQQRKHNLMMEQIRKEREEFERKQQEEERARRLRDERRRREEEEQEEHERQLSKKLKELAEQRQREEEEARRRAEEEERQKAIQDENRRKAEQERLELERKQRQAQEEAERLQREEEERQRAEQRRLEAERRERELLEERRLWEEEQRRKEEERRREEKRLEEERIQREKERLEEEERMRKLREEEEQRRKVFEEEERQRLKREWLEKRDLDKKRFLVQQQEEKRAKRDEEQTPDSSVPKDLNQILLKFSRMEEIRSEWVQKYRAQKEKLKARAQCVPEYHQQHQGSFVLTEGETVSMRHLSSTTVPLEQVTKLDMSMRGIGKVNPIVALTSSQVALLEKCPNLMTLVLNANKLQALDGLESNKKLEEIFAKVCSVDG